MSPLPAPDVTYNYIQSRHSVFDMIVLYLYTQTLKGSLQRKLQERQQDLVSKQEALAAANAENEALRARIAAQPFNKADINRMAMER